MFLYTEQETMNRKLYIITKRKLMFTLSVGRTKETISGYKDGRPPLKYRHYLLLSKRKLSNVT